MRDEIYDGFLLLELGQDNGTAVLVGVVVDVAGGASFLQQQQSSSWQISRKR